MIIIIIIGCFLNWRTSCVNMLLINCEDDNHNFIKLIIIKVIIISTPSKGVQSNHHHCFQSCSKQNVNLFQIKNIVYYFGFEINCERLTVNWLSFRVL